MTAAGLLADLARGITGPAGHRDAATHWYLTHGEREDSDPHYLGADGNPRCLCGADWYLLCPGNSGPGSLSQQVFTRGTRHAANG